MLDGLERNDRVDAGRRKREGRGAALGKAKVRAIQVRFGRMRDRRLIDVDADDALGNLAEQRAAITFAAGDVEDTLAGDKAARESVAVPVLMRDLAFCSRHKSFAGEFQRMRHEVLGLPQAAATRAGGGSKPGF